MAIDGEYRSSAARVSAQQVRAMLKDGREIALLDVREEGVFSEWATRSSPIRCRCPGSSL
jgi:hypothetical protein